MPYHYFASCFACWATGATRAEAIERLAHEVGTSTIKVHRKQHGGLYVWTVRVDLPHDAHYAIEEYRPINVPLAHPMDFRLRSMQGDVTLLREA